MSWLKRSLRNNVYLCTSRLWMLVNKQCSNHPACRAWSRRRKGGPAWIASILWSLRSPNFWTVQSCFLSAKCFFFFSDSIHLLINRWSNWSWVRCTKLKAVGLGLKLYPSNMTSLYPKIEQENGRVYYNLLKRQWILTMVFSFTWDHSASVDGTSTDASVVSNVLEEIKLLLQKPWKKNNQEWQITSR